MKHGISKVIVLSVILTVCAAAMALAQGSGQPAGAPPAATPATPAVPGQPGMGQQGGALGDRARQFQQRRMNRPGGGALGMNRSQHSPLEMFDSIDKNIQSIDKQLKTMKGGDASVYRRWFLILALIGAANAVLLLLILVTLMKKNSGSA